MRGNAEQQPHQSHLFYISELNETEIAWQLSHVKAEIAGLHLTKASTACSTGILLQSAAAPELRPTLAGNNPLAATPGAPGGPRPSPKYSNVPFFVWNGLGWNGNRAQELNSLWFHQDVGTENLLE